MRTRALPRCLSAAVVCLATDRASASRPLQRIICLGPFPVALATRLSPIVLLTTPTRCPYIVRSWLREPCQTRAVLGSFRRVDGVVAAGRGFGALVLASVATIAAQVKADPSNTVRVPHTRRRSFSVGCWWGGGVLRWPLSAAVVVVVVAVCRRCRRRWVRLALVVVVVYL